MKAKLSPPGILYIGIYDNIELSLEVVWLGCAMPIKNMFSS